MDFARSNYLLPQPLNDRHIAVKQIKCIKGIYFSVGFDEMNTAAFYPADAKIMRVHKLHDDDFGRETIFLNTHHSKTFGLIRG